MLPERDRRRVHPRFQGEQFGAKPETAAGAWSASPRRKGRHQAQIALAWVLHQGEDIIPIPGTKRRKYLEENAAAADIKLSAEDLAALDKAFPPGVTSGLRYPEPDMKRIGL